MMFEIFPLTHWSWVVLGLTLLVFELMVPFAFFLWLGASAFVVAVILFLFPEMSWQIQFGLFSILSIVSIILSRQFLFNKEMNSELPNLNRRELQYIGRTFSLSEPIVNGYGKISVDDSFWRVTGPELESGSKVRVVAADDSVLEVEAV